jgi:hypothetical protein
MFNKKFFILFLLTILTVANAEYILKIANKSDVPKLLKKVFYVSGTTTTETIFLGTSSTNNTYTIMTTDNKFGNYIDLELFDALQESTKKLQ